MSPWETSHALPMDLRTYGLMNLLRDRRSRHGHGRARGVGRRRDELPRLLLLEQLRRHGRVQRVPAAMRDGMRGDGVSEEREAADEIEDLVADELVFEAQRAVEDAGVANHDRVVERSAQRQTVLAQHLHFLQEGERARWRDLVDERVFV